ncbi:MAG: hypothetical protein ACOH1L_10610 [Thermomonas sp.]
MQQDDAAGAMHEIAKGDRIMLRKLLLPMLATAALAGCATDYQYRGGQGDYYYGQPQVEYRHSGPSGFYGDIGLGYGSGFGGFGYGFGASYFYDRYGRLVYGYPGRYYGSPYYGRGGWYPPRPPRGHGDGGNHHGDGDNRQDRPPPWRDLGQLQQRDPDEDGYRNREARERQDRRLLPESYREAPMRTQRSPATAPAVRERSERRESSSRMGSFIGDASRSRGTRETRVEE